MGDDPYDFEIAIPRHKAEKSSRYAAAQSDDDEDDESEEEEEMDDSGESDSPKRKPQQQQQQPKRTTAATPASSSALDKAKSFLSKYSSKPVAGGGASKALSRYGSLQQVELVFGCTDWVLKFSATHRAEHGRLERQLHGRFG